MQIIYYVLTAAQTVAAQAAEARGASLVAASAAIVQAHAVDPVADPAECAQYEEFAWRGQHSADIRGERWCAMTCSRNGAEVIVVSRAPTLFVPTPHS